MCSSTKCLAMVWIATFTSAGWMHWECMHGTALLIHSCFDFDRCTYWSPLQALVRENKDLFLQSQEIKQCLLNCHRACKAVTKSTCGRKLLAICFLFGFRTKDAQRLTVGIVSARKILQPIQEFDDPIEWSPNDPYEEDFFHQSSFLNLESIL